MLIFHNSKELHIISNGKMPMEQLGEILSDIHPYITAIHIREKQKTAQEIYQAVDLFTKVNIPRSKIIINDRVDVALVTGVAGVQLAYHSLDASIVKMHFPHLMLGCSIHSYKEGHQAEQKGANYVLYGHIFPSKSKPGLLPKGLAELKKLTGQLNIPVIAIGGITAENTKHVIHAGAKGIAVMSGILEAHDPLLAVMDYQKSLNNEEVQGGKFI
jgi:thiazole tautomerase (transcriptional regulator TenI)